jgi:hypothetical protein
VKTLTADISAVTACFQRYLSKLFRCKEERRRKGERNDVRIDKRDGNRIRGERMDGDKNSKVYIRLQLSFQRLLQ